MRVLLLPPTQRDAVALQNLFAEEKFPCVVCRDMKELCEEVRKIAGVVLLAEEALTAAAEEYAECVQRQPVWSDLTTIVLSHTGAESPRLTQVLHLLGNVSVVERPVRVTTLLSLVRSALRARERQYQVRAYLHERERVDLERVRLLDSERAARSAADRAGRMKDEFLATLSHELRTPLNAILGWSQVLARSTPNPEELADGLKKIERNARAQAQIIEDLLDMSSIISGKVRLQLREVDLAMAVYAAVDTVRPAADAKDVRIDIVLDPAAAMINADPNRLQQILWNLLSNAVKFTPRSRSVRVVVERGISHIAVQVQDTGQGISAEFLPQVFDRFRQADASSTRRHGGLGLGLAIVKQLVELHGGGVTAESAGEGLGTTFTVLLPVATVRPTDRTPERPTSKSNSVIANVEHGHRIRGARLLVVDDEEDSRDLMKRLLEDCGAIVSAAASAEDAFAQMLCSRPDVLVSDIGMPDEDGYTLLRRIRALGDEHGGNIPAVALTAYARPEDRAHSIHAGFQRHVVKPVEPADLIAAVAALVGTTLARTSDPVLRAIEEVERVS
jgi:signal transduction histidine kinase/CheY-like chemotaxis protein